MSLTEASSTPRQRRGDSGLRTQNEDSLCGLRAFVRSQADDLPESTLAGSNSSTPQCGFDETVVHSTCTLREVIKMKSTAMRFVLLLLIGLVAMSALVVAQGTPAPLGIMPTPTPQPLTVSIWTDKTMYVIGESATIYFTVSERSYIYIYDIQPDGVVRLIFPNGYSQGNYVSAGTHALPDGLYQFTVAPPTGTEQLQIIASPLDLGLNPHAFYEPFPLVGTNPQTATNEIQVQIMGIVPEPTYVSDWTSFQIVTSYGYTPPAPSYAPPAPSYYPYPPFYPPFYGYPGATWYWGNGEWHSGVPASGWHWVFGSDGSWHFRITFHFGIGD